MKAKEFLPERKDLFGVYSPSPDEIAAKHRVPLDKIMHQLRMGIKVEQEHTPDKNLAREIALDHLNELPDYYDRLKKMEHGEG